MAKVLCVLYDDPVDGYPTSYARDEIPQIGSYPGVQAASEAGLTIAEITLSNSISVSEHVGDDDPVAGPQLPPLLPVGGQGRVEHRRLRAAVLRRRRHGRRDGCRRADRLGGAQAAQAVRREAALHRRAPAARGRRARAWRHLL